MRKFYKITRADLVDRKIDDKELLLPGSFENNFFNLGYFASKHSVYDYLYEIAPELFHDGSLIEPSFSGYCNEGHADGYLVKGFLDEGYKLYMVIELQAS